MAILNQPPEGILDNPQAHLQGGEGGGAPPAPEAPPAAGAPPEGGPLIGGPPPSTDPSMMPGGEEVDQRQVDAFMEVAYRVMYGGPSQDGELNPGVAGMLRMGREGGEAADPVGALASTSASISSKALTTARDEGKNLDGAAAFAGLTQVVGELSNVAEMEGIYDYTDEEISTALMRAGEEFWNQSKETGVFPQDEMDRDTVDMQAGTYDPEIQQLGLA